MKGDWCTTFRVAAVIGQRVPLPIRRELTSEEIARLAQTYHAWRGEPDAGAYEDVPGFCKSATLDEIRRHGFILTPGRYVGAEDVADEQSETFEEKMRRLVATLEEQFAEDARLTEAIRAKLKGLDYGTR